MENYKSKDWITYKKRDLGLTMYGAPNAVEKLKPPRKHQTVGKLKSINNALKNFEVI